MVGSKLLATVQGIYLLSNRSHRYRILSCDKVKILIKRS